METTAILFDLNDTLVANEAAVEAALLATCVELQSRSRLAVVTNGAPALQREKLEGTGLAPYFAIVTVSGEVGIGKPDPRIFAHTLAHLGVPPAEAVMAGNDLTRDIRGARKAGITGIWVNRTGAADVVGDTTPDADITSLPDLVQMFRGLPAIRDEEWSRGATPF